MSTDEACSFAEAPDAGGVPVPLQGPVAFNVVERRTKSNMAAIVLATPFTFALDACAAMGRGMARE